MDEQEKMIPVTIDEARIIRKTGEMSTRHACPCCGHAIYDCDCPLVMIDVEWHCTRHHQGGKWPKGE